MTDRAACGACGCVTQLWTHSQSNLRITSYNAPDKSRTYAFSSATFLEAESFQEGDTLESA